MHQKRLSLEHRFGLEYCCAETFRFRLVHPDDSRFLDSVVEALQSLAASAKSIEASGRPMIWREMVLDGSLSASDYEVELPESKIKELFEGLLHYRFQAHGPVFRDGEKGQHLFRLLLCGWQKPRSETSGRNNGLPDQTLVTQSSYLLF